MTVAEESFVTPEEISAVEAAQHLEKYEKLCWHLARKVLGSRADDIHLWEDVAAEIRIQFVRATKTFDKSRGLAFSTYAVRVAVFNAKRWLRRYDGRGLTVPANLKPGKTPEPPPIFASLTDTIPGTDTCLSEMVSCTDPPVSDFPKDLWKLIGTVLTPREQRAVRMRYRDGMGLKEIATAVGVSKERVRQIIDDSLSKIREKLPYLKDFC